MNYKRNFFGPSRPDLWKFSRKKNPACSVSNNWFRLADCLFGSKRKYLGVDPDCLLAYQQIYNCTEIDSIALVIGVGSKQNIDASHLIAIGADVETFYEIDLSEPLPFDCTDNPE
jgi:hypothetical protein